MNIKIPLEKILSDSKILIVDDSKTSREILVELCKSMGFKYIEEASDGKSGLERIEIFRPDLVFIDMNMSHLNGLQVCYELKRRNISDDMTIIMQTISNKPEIKEQAFKAGITDFIIKPIDSTDVISRTMAHLERLFLHRQVESNFLRISKELKEAAVLQNILLPDEALLRNIKGDSGIDIAYHFQPAMEMAGDYLSVRRLSENKIALISIDVSGHGVTAALYAFSIHTLLDNKIIENQEPGKILEILNAQLHNLMTTDRFATIFLGIIDIENMRLDYAASAAPPPILISKSGINYLNTRGHLLGTQKNIDYVADTIALKKDDILFIYSDALIETVDFSGNVMQEQEISNILLKNKLNDSSSLLKSVLTPFYISYSKQLVDDLSILVCRI